MAWVRSQDKKSVQHSHRIRLQEVFQMPDCQLLADLTLSPTQEYTVIGTFSTKKRALEELNRIYDWIALQNARGVYQVSQEDK